MKCPICQQKSDLFVTSHKNKPFVDNKLYPKICFTCFSAPKTMLQKYKEDGSVKEEIELEYSADNLYSAKELFEAGSADNLNQAKNCIKAIKNLQIQNENNIKKNKPKMELYLN